MTGAQRLHQTVALQPTQGRVDLPHVERPRLGGRLLELGFQPVAVGGLLGQDGQHAQGGEQAGPGSLAAGLSGLVEVVSKDTERDNFMNAEEAMTYGLIDKVIQKRVDKKEDA